MDQPSFQRMVARLEQESARSAGSYRAKVAALALLGFAILGLVVLLAGFGLVLLAGLAIALVYTGGAALILLLKLGKGLVIVALALWFLIKSAMRALFMRLPAPAGVEVTRAQAPALFDAIDAMRQRLKGPRFHHVLVVEQVNAAVVQRPAFGLFGWPRNYLLLGLPLLESLPPEEALAVVAHEYGHLAGSHGHFEAFIYRLRHTWATIQAHADLWQGWSGRPLQRLVRWYAPYFNAYTFVLARANEYQADAASAELVGAPAAAHALKRVNLVAPRHDAFLEQTFERIADEPQPPMDLLQRWAGQLQAPAPDAQRWLDEALEREAATFDTHPALRQRLSALPGEAERAALPPPEPATASAAQAWLAPLLDTLRAHFSAEWAARVAQPWAERHGELQQQRARLAALREQAERSTEETLEMLNLQRQHEPQNDVREALAAFNAAHPAHALGVYLEGLARLDKDDAEGVPLMERAMQLDREATLPVCDRLHAFFRKRKDPAAETWAERWRQRAEFEQTREAQRRTLDVNHTLVPAELDAETLASVRERLTPLNLADLKAVYLVRRQLPIDPTLPTYVLGLELTLLARLLRRHAAVRDRMVKMPWPMHLMVLPFDRSLRGYAKKIRQVAGARVA